MSKNIENKLVPRLRFHEFRNLNSWELLKLNELLFETKIRNRDLKYNHKDVLSVSGEYGCVNQIDFLGRSYAGFSVKEYHVVEMGDIVYTKSPLKKNPYGIIKENKGKPGIVSTLYAVYRVTNKAYPTYLDYYFSNDYTLNSYLQPIVRKGAKNDMKVNNFAVLGGNVFAPEIPEQQKIAACLTSLDDVITAETQKLELLKEHKKGLLQNLLPQEGETVPRLRFKEFEKEGDWVEKTVGEVFDFKVTNSFSREYLNYEKGKVKNIHYGDIHTKFNTLFDITKEYVPYINQDVSIEKIKKESYCIEGDIIFADASEDLNDVGKSIEIINLNNEKLVSGLHTLLARQRENKLASGFVGYLFKSDWVRKQIQREAQGTKVLGISATRISYVKIMYPLNPKEQQKVASCLSSLDALIDSQAEKSETLKLHKKGLLQGLFPEVVEVN